MRKIIAVAGFFVFGAAQAEVYKCTDASGKTIYQSKACETGVAQQVDIKTFDEKKIAEAQAKLAESLKQEAEREAAAAEAAQKERELAAREALAEQVRQQRESLDRNARAVEIFTQPQPPVDYFQPPPPRNNPPQP